MKLYSLLTLRSQNKQDFLLVKVDIFQCKSLTFVKQYLLQHFKETVISVVARDLPTNSKGISKQLF